MNIVCNFKPFGGWRVVQGSTASIQYMRVYMDKYVNINFSCFADEIKWATAYLIKFKIVVVLNMAINILAILLYSMSGVKSFDKWNFR